VDCRAQDAGETQDRACQERYQRLFADGVVDITIAHGYGDSAGVTNDRVWSENVQAGLLQRLTGACPSTHQLNPTTNYGGTPEEIAAAQADRDRTSCGGAIRYSQACGFRRTDDPEILEKRVQVNNRQVTVRLRMMNSALSASDSRNRDTRRQFVEQRVCHTFTGERFETCVSRNSAPAVPLAQLVRSCRPGDHVFYQPCRSDYVRSNWTRAIRQGSEMVMYKGHARSGGGPDFEPPRVLENGKVDYAWYRRVRPGHTLEAEALRGGAAAGKPPVFYGSHSCGSHRHFMRNGQFPGVSPSTAYVLSSRTAFTDEGSASVLALISNALNRRCGDDMKTNIQRASCAYTVYNF
jgi:hypothetical protein